MKLKRKSAILTSSMLSLWSDFIYVPQQILLLTLVGSKLLIPITLIKLPANGPLYIDPLASGFEFTDPDKSLVDKVYKNLPNSIRSDAHAYIAPILDIARKYHVDPWWVLAVTWTESHFQHGSISGVGARGLMQIMPQTQRYLEKRYVTQLLSFDKYPIRIPLKTTSFQEQLRNIEFGTAYLALLLKRFKSIKLATIAYNMGPTWTRKQLNRKRRIGDKNIYLNKVNRSYRYITKRIGIE